MNSEAATEKLAQALAGISVRLDTAGAIDIQQAEVLAAALLPAVREIAAEELRAAADQIDRGPTFSLPPSIISALVRERADALTGQTTPS